jgi:hypothetical protein
VGTLGVQAACNFIATPPRTLEGSLSRFACAVEQQLIVRTIIGIGASTESNRIHLKRSRLPHRLQRNAHLGVNARLHRQRYCPFATTRHIFSGLSFHSSRRTATIRGTTSTGSGQGQSHAKCWWRFLKPRPTKACSASNALAVVPFDIHRATSDICRHCDLGCRGVNTELCGA